MNDHIVFWLLVAVIALAVSLIWGGIRLERVRSDVAQLALELQLLSAGFVEPRCRVCDCTDEVACLTGCWWVEEDLCSSCADDAATHSSFEVYLPDDSPERHRGLVDEVLNRLRRGREA